MELHEHLKAMDNKERNLDNIENHNEPILDNIVYYIELNNFHEEKIRIHENFNDHSLVLKHMNAIVDNDLMISDLNKQLITE